MIRIATLSSPIELDMLKELFDDNGIQISVSHRESGEFMTIYMGNSIFGVDVYVSEADEERARELYALYFEESQSIDEEALTQAALAADLPPEDDL